MVLVMTEKRQAIIKRKNGDGEEIKVSCYLTQNHELTLTPTNNPVEEGIDITDHVKRNPKKITLRGITTDDPLSFSATIDAFKTLVDPVSGQPQLPSNDTFKAFQELYENQELVYIATTYENYFDMLLTSFTTQEDKDNGSSIDFTASFTEIMTVDTATSTSTNLAGAKESARAARAADVAARAQEEKIAAKKPKPPAPTKPISILKRSTKPS